MADIFDYVNWRGDISFEISPFNDIDNLKKIVEKIKSIKR